MSRDAAIDKTVVLDVADIALPLERAPLLMTNGWLKWLERDWSPYIFPYRHSIFSWTIYEVRRDINSNLLWLSDLRHVLLSGAPRLETTHSENTWDWSSPSKRSWELGWRAARACLWVCLGWCLKGSCYIWCCHQTSRGARGRLAIC